tara:strand:+ start:3630 stop:4352 length:723 start_codon:yes stop_codon:yes gene_type:complete
MISDIKINSVLGKGETTVEAYNDFMLNIFQYLFTYGRLMHPKKNIPIFNKFHMLRKSISCADGEGYWFEFGIHEGGTLKQTSHKIQYSHPGTIIHGFDSFEGLPEDWNSDNPKGFFNLDGEIPSELLEVKNINVVKGWFDESLPKFIEENEINKVSFLNIDSDLYSSAKTILDNLQPYFKGKCVIHFDEFCNYEGGQEGEYKAFREFVYDNRDNIINIQPIGKGMPMGYSSVSFLITFKD